jgi:hypothetical protein
MEVVMDVLLWLVFSWMAFGTLIGLGRILLLDKATAVVGGLVASTVNVLACIVIAIAAVAL